MPSLPPSAIADDGDCGRAHGYFVKVTRAPGALLGAEVACGGLARQIREIPEPNENVVFSLDLAQYHF